MGRLIVVSRYVLSNFSGCRIKKLECKRGKAFLVFLIYCSCKFEDRLVLLFISKPTGNIFFI